VTSDQIPPDLQSRIAEFGDDTYELTLDFDRWPLSSSEKWLALNLTRGGFPNVMKFFAITKFGSIVQQFYNSYNFFGYVIELGTNKM